MRDDVLISEEDARRLGIKDGACIQCPPKLSLREESSAASATPLAKAVVLAFAIVRKQSAA
jgi:hypothetical protein